MQNCPKFWQPIELKHRTIKTNLTQFITVIHSLIIYQTIKSSLHHHGGCIVLKTAFYHKQSRKPVFFERRKIKKTHRFQHTSSVTQTQSS